MNLASRLLTAAFLGAAAALIFSSHLCLKYGVALIFRLLAEWVKWTSPIQEYRPIPWDENGVFSKLQVSSSNSLNTSTSKVLEPPPPNIILIVLDDTGFNDVLMDDRTSSETSSETLPETLWKTPNMYQMAKEGTRYTHAYAGSAICSPSRASILTGRHASEFGFSFTPLPNHMTTLLKMASAAQDEKEGIGLPLIFNDTAVKQAPRFEEQGLSLDAVTLAEMLKQHPKTPYRTAHVGKWHLGHGPNFSPVKQGFDESVILSGGLYLPKDDPNVVNDYQDYSVLDQVYWSLMRQAVKFMRNETLFENEKNEKSEKSNNPLFKPNRYLTDYFTDEAVHVLESHAKTKEDERRPLFLYLAHWGVHAPLQALKSDYDTLSHITHHGTRVYAAMMKAVDRSVGKVRKTLKRLKMEDNTMVIVTSDNGPTGYVGIDSSNKPFRGWKLSYFEGGVRVPFFYTWPGHVEEGQTISDPISHMDIYSTVADAAGIPPSIVSRPETSHSLFQKTKKPRHLYWTQGKEYKAIKSADNWKLIMSTNPLKTWLFDLNTDPTEKIDLTHCFPDKLESLKSLLEQHQRKQQEPNWPSILQAPVLIDKCGADAYKPGDEYSYFPN